jgi:hypothetical protein
MGSTIWMILTIVLIQGQLGSRSMIMGRNDKKKRDELAIGGSFGHLGLT